MVLSAAKLIFDQKSGYEGEISFRISGIKDGRADLVYKSDVDRSAAVWEIKPISYANPKKKYLAQTQVARYRALAQKEAYSPEGDKRSYSIGSQGGAPLPIEGTLKFKITDGVYEYDISMFIPKGQGNEGLIYYTIDDHKLTEQTEKAYELAKKTSVVTAKGVAITGVVVGAVILAPETGGASLAGAGALIPVIINPDIVTGDDNDLPQEGEIF